MLWTMRRKGFFHFCFWFVTITTMRSYWRLTVTSSGPKMLEMDDSYLQLLHPTASVSSEVVVNDTTTLSQSSTSFTLLPTEEVPRFFMGIFTVLGEQKLRDAVRQNFHLYQDPRVCAHGSLILPSSKLRIPRHCRLVYTFVMGIAATSANETGVMTTQVIDPPLITSAPPPGYNASLEPLDDVTFLNIKENMNHGKTLTWFRYASQVIITLEQQQQQHPGIDYIIKCDSDTGLRLDLFWPFVQQHLQHRGRSVYAGLLKWSHHARAPYMLGQFYILSRDLANAVSLLPLEQERDPLIQHIEDADMGYLLSKLAMTPLIQFVGFPYESESMVLPWKHGLKTPERHQRFRGLEIVRWCGGLRQARERKDGKTTLTMLDVNVPLTTPSSASLVRRAHGVGLCSVLMS